ncbi:MAG: hypothetical protein QN198_09460 [Armatimonadota bacterium]|nr:hypothetical protein [Armatimonadota bacterium]MDR5703820.1 hypothetical protein [Armatimonadota bacterium]MDR7433772.1 hypothetical protein [Armatimonadota bacterium]
MEERRQEAVGKWLGIAVFVVGILLLALVFFLAYRDIVGESGLLTLGSSGGRPVTEVVWILVVRVLFLFLMGYLASVIAARGIAMYQASREG